MKASRSGKSVTNEITHPIISDYFGGIFYNANAERECRKKTTGLTFERLNPTLFREFATECMESARGATSPKERTLFLKLSGMWEQLAQSWEKKGLVGAKRLDCYTDYRGRPGELLSFRRRDLTTDPGTDCTARRPIGRRRRSWSCPSTVNLNSYRNVAMRHSANSRRRLSVCP